MMDLSLTENDARGRLPAGWTQHSGFGHLAYGIQIYPHLVSARPIRGFSPRPGLQEDPVMGAPSHHCSSDSDLLSAEATRPMGRVALKAAVSAPC